MTPWVRADNVTGAYEAVRHLVRLGHRRIAHIRGPREYLASHDRHRGYLQALREAGIAFDDDLILEGAFLSPSGYECAQHLFDLAPEKRPSAIFASADQMAYGVLRAAEERNLSVPGDIALVGFDDDAPSAHVRPPLSTVHQPSFEMGQEGIRLLLALLAESEGSDAPTDASLTRQGRVSPLRVVLPTRLVIRASCGASEHGSNQSAAATSAQALPAAPPDVPSTPTPSAS
jgi:LacI family transcriptional regulator